MSQTRERGEMGAGERAGLLQVCTGEGWFRLQAWRQVYSCRHRHHSPTHLCGDQVSDDLYQTFERRLFFSLLSMYTTLKSSLVFKYVYISGVMYWNESLHMRFYCSSCAPLQTCAPLLPSLPFTHPLSLSLFHSLYILLPPFLFLSLPFYLYIS